MWDMYRNEYLLLVLGDIIKKKTFNLWMKFLKYAVLSKHTKSEF